MQKYRTHIGDMIRNTRKALHMSQMQLAEKIGVSYQQIQKYEKGQSELTISRLYQIADALGIDPVSFLPSKTTTVAESVAPYGKGASQDEAILMNLFRQIKNKKIKDSLCALLKGVMEIEKKRP
ncbi:MAG: helix-turn-helix domain-containing protein [Nitrospirae bacterium]|nr:helix-turn-helix domain-containing protein [Nitrospirota bacterium]